MKDVPTFDPGSLVTQKKYKAISDITVLDKVIDAVREVLMEGYVTRLVLDASKPFVYYEKKAPLDKESTPITIDTVLSTVEMEDVEVGEADLANCLKKLFDLVTSSGLEAHSIVVNSLSNTFKKAGLHPNPIKPTLFGVPVIQNSASLPEETLLVCAAPHRESPLEEIKKIFKVSI